MKVIGITGSIATGKSTVTKYLLSLGYHVIDADRISFEMLEPTGDGYDLIVQHFGSTFLNDDQTINRAMLSKEVFSHETSRLLINKLIHPLIFKQIETQIRQTHLCDIVFVDVPLLYEAGFDVLCDFVVCVYAPVALQIKRMVENRHLSLDEAKLRTDSQMSIETKKLKADWVINNLGTIEDLYRQVDKLLLEIERR